MTEQYTDTLMELRIDYAANHPGGKMDSLHYHDAYEIYILEKGERNHLIDDTLVCLAGREVALIKPFELHSTDGSAYSRYVLYFKEEYLDRYMTAAGKAALLAVFSQKKLTLSEEAYQRVTALLLELNAAHDDFLLLAEIMRILRASKEASVAQEAQAESLIARITEYLGQHFIDFCGLDALADRFFITKHYLCRLFKKETGLSVVTYVNAQRLQRAAEELRFSRKSIKRIAAECGFHSSGYFSRTFREQLGISPLEYRRKHQI